MNKDRTRETSTRRGLIKRAAVVAAGVASAAASRTSSGAERDTGRLEKTHLKLGFMPLTDCASLVMAQELGLYAKYGLDVTITRESSWAAIRDKLVLGQLDAAHGLYGLIYGIHLGLSGQRQDMAVLMGLNQNGQGIVLSNVLADAGATDGPGLQRLVAAKAREYSFAQTFPTGTHAMWLYYWLAANGIDPFRDVHTVVVPPPRMVASMREGRIDGFCAGEPWAALAAAEGIGHTVATSQAIWPNHPEKVLGCSRRFVQQNPNTARALVMALIESARYCDSPANRKEVAKIIAREHYVDAPVDLVLDRFTGRYDDGRGHRWQDAHPMRFFADGDASFPYLSHGMWFVTQHQRWGFIDRNADPFSIASEINQVALYSEAADALGVNLPDSPMKTERLFDGVVWDPARAADYLEQFPIKA